MSSKQEFTSSWVKLPSRPTKPLHLVSSNPPDTHSKTPLILLHGLGSSSSFWVTPLLTNKGQEILAGRQVIAYDFDGHGLSDWSGADGFGVQHLVDDLKEVLEVLGISKVFVGGHSMSGTVATLFAHQYPERVEGLFLLNAVRNIPVAVQQSMHNRATQFTSSLSSRSSLAHTISTTAISKHTLSTSLTVPSFIRHLVLGTNPQSYAGACIAIANAPKVSLAGLKGVKVSIVGGKEDYLAGKEAVEAWISEMDADEKGTYTVLDDVGHWGAIEAPESVAKALAEFLA